MTPDFARYLESLLAGLYAVPEPRAADEPEPDPLALDDWTRFVAWGLRREVRARKELVIEFRVPATPHSDHAHRLLLDAGARVCPCCGLYIFLADPRAKFLIGQHDSWRNGDTFFIGEPPRCPLCEVR